MSESVGSVVADAPAADAPAPISPPPNTQERLTISDAARMLRGARQPPQRAESGQQAGDSGQQAPAAPEPPAESMPARKGPDGVEAMTRALGLKQETAEPADDAAAPETGDGLDLDGRRWSHDQLREQIRLATDYTRKTQEVAQQRQEIEQQRAALAQFMPLIQPELERMQQQIAQVVYPDPALRHTDPAAYWDQVARFNDAQVNQHRLIQMQQMQMQARDAALAQQVEEGNRTLAQKYAFWADPAQRQQVQSWVTEWALTQGGYTRDELRGLSNPKHLETLMKAASFDAHIANTRTSAPQPTVRRAPTGSAPPPRPAEQVAAAAEAFANKPSWQNGAALLSAQSQARTRGNGHSNW
jgi:hypothetical protein